MSLFFEYDIKAEPSHDYVTWLTDRSNFWIKLLLPSGRFPANYLVASIIHYTIKKLQYKFTLVVELHSPWHIVAAEMSDNYIFTLFGTVLNALLVGQELSHPRHKNKSRHAHLDLAAYIFYFVWSGNSVIDIWSNIYQHMVEQAWRRDNPNVHLIDVSWDCLSNFKTQTNCSQPGP